MFSPYKDVGLTDGNSDTMNTAVTGTSQAVVQAMPARLTTMTWAFATGSCGTENWAGMSAAAFAKANVQSFVNAGKKYIVGTGGAAGNFKCASDANFATFVNRYMSPNMVGVDFDIEGGTQTDIDNLVARVVAAQQTFPNLRFSFTIGTLGGNTEVLSSWGTMTMKSIKSHGLTNYIINLMVMDYADTNGATAHDCALNSSGKCDMGQSAINAANLLHNTYGVPYSQIELTPMIGGNDSPDEIFTIQDAATISFFVKANGLAGIHFWSFDRDTDCPNGPASDTCNNYGLAGTLGFTNAFIQDLGL